MRLLTILIVLVASLALLGCSQEEKTATAPLPAEKPKVMQQTQEKVEQVAEQAQEKVAQVGEQAKAVVEKAENALSSVSGEAVYTKACLSCHKLGIAGAPKTGDKAAWTPLVASGIEQLHNNAINGKGKMPAKGGNATLSDDEVRAAVEYMVEQSK